MTLPVVAIWLQLGSLAVLDGEGRVFDRRILIRPDEGVHARYDKIHMFDADLGDEDVYRESDTYRSENLAVTTGLPWGQLGLTICYDLRFPYLYNELARAGPHFIVVPSAFTRRTGSAHWYVLLQARAIETGCWVFAAAQCVNYSAGRQTYGHSLIIVPWRPIVAEAGDKPGIVMADIDVSQVTEVRRAILVLANARRFNSAAIKPDTE